ncbi:probable serine/threonine-protein kinase fhkB isoform X2 [Folsomia candida]|uniref:probable serine/threonine-protein kinase fhkB isoform X2 n=1 Tax=Folsomia candida TaxID=158441 RepID=UPI0016051976|nr:probable serine/threonine-protein kinase fhkB isoform X2 [Folsomia candida]
MDSRTFFILALGTYITLIFLESATCRSHGLKYHHHHYQSHLHNSNRNHHQNHPHSLDYNSGETPNAVLNQERNTVPKHGKSTPTSWRPSSSDDDYEDEDDGGRHAYLMLPSSKKSSSERITEDQTLTQAFEKHMKPGTPNIHDVYAYQLPSDLWFIVRYSKNEDGQVEKYIGKIPLCRHHRARTTVRSIRSYKSYYDLNSSFQS